MNRSLTNTGAPGNHTLMAAPAVTASYKQWAILAKSQSPAPLRVIKGKKFIEELPEKKLKPQQLIAGIAFNLFGLGTLAVNEVNTQVIYLANYTGTHAIAVDFAAPFATIKQPGQSLHGFNLENEIAEKGEIYNNSVTEYTADLTAGTENGEVVSFSKVMGERELMIIYNTSAVDANEKFILMHNNSSVTKMNVVYGYEVCGHVHVFHSTVAGKPISYLKIYLMPLQLVVLKNY